MNQRYATFVLLLPIYVAMLVHAIGLDRWSLAIPGLIGLAIATTRREPLRLTARHWYVAILAGGVIGLLVPAAQVINGLLPPNVAATITGVAVVLSVMSAFAGKIAIAWVAAWALVAISGKVQADGTLVVAIAIFFIAQMFAVLSIVELTRLRTKLLAPIGIFAILVALSTAATAVALHRMDQLFLKTFETVMTSNGTSSTTGLSDSIRLGPRGNIVQSERILFELSGISGLLRNRVLDQFDGSNWTTSMQLEQRSLSFDAVRSEAVADRRIELWFFDSLGDAIPAPAGTRDVKGAAHQVSGGWIVRGIPDSFTVNLSCSREASLPTEQQPGGDLLAVPKNLKVNWP
ncbi:MAG: transglutaminaseTgpA domain-containing protein [Pirellulaceae bacterium]